MDTPLTIIDHTIQHVIHTRSLPDDFEAVRADLAVTMIHGDCRVGLTSICGASMHPDEFGPFVNQQCNQCDGPLTEPVQMQCCNTVLCGYCVCCTILHEEPCRQCDMVLTPQMLRMICNSVDSVVCKLLRQTQQSNKMMIIMSDIVTQQNPSDILHAENIVYYTCGKVPQLHIVTPINPTITDAILVTTKPHIDEIITLVRAQFKQLKRVDKYWADTSEYMARVKAVNVTREYVQGTVVALFEN